MDIRINEVDYSWHDSFATMSIDEYMELIKHVILPPNERVSKYTGIPLDVINRMTTHQFRLIAESVEYIENEALLNALAEPYTGKIVNESEYRKLIKVKGLTKESNIIDHAVGIAEIYTGEKLTGSLLLDSWHKVSFYLRSLSAFFERFKRLNTFEHTDEEIMAGVERLAIYGDFATIVKIGRERGMSNDEVLSLSAEEVYMEMLLDFDRSEFQKEYQRIINQKQTK